MEKKERTQSLAAGDIIGVWKDPHKKKLIKKKKNKPLGSNTLFIQKYDKQTGWR